MTVATREGRETSELHLTGQAREVPIPFDGASEYLCPSCERRIPNALQVRLGKPPKFESVLNDVLKCPLPKKGYEDEYAAVAHDHSREGRQRRGKIPRCGFIFSPKNTAVVVRG